MSDRDVWIRHATGQAKDIEEKEVLLAQAIAFVAEIKTHRGNFNLCLSANLRLLLASETLKNSEEDWTRPSATDYGSRWWGKQHAIKRLLCLANEYNRSPSPRWRLSVQNFLQP